MNHETTLREALRLALQATGKRAKEAAFCEGEDALNALLAEHRASLASARAEGYAEAKAQAAERYEQMATDLRESADHASAEKLRLLRIEHAEQWESEARIIRAMEPKKP
jgi:hypothetical protein